MYRLTVHLADVPRKETRTGKRIKDYNGKMIDEVKIKIHNVLSFECETKADIAKQLGQIRNQYTIRKGEAGIHKVSKVDKEFIQVSNIK